MSAKSILLVNDDPSLLECFQNGADAPIVSTRSTARLRQKFKHQTFPLVILETKKDWTKDLKRLLNNGGRPDDGCMIIASAGILKQTAAQIREMTLSLFEKATAASSAPNAKLPRRKIEMSLALEEFLEQRLKAFIQQMKTSGGSNLYSILLQEIERPLITITLKETNGNQLQASHLLGMNRNTLRKKIREMKIRVHKTSQPHPK